MDSLHFSSCRMTQRLELAGTEEESGAASWQVVQEVPLTSLYNVVSPPPGEPTGRLRLHPQALLIVR